MVVLVVMLLVVIVRPVRRWVWTRSAASPARGRTAAVVAERLRGGDGAAALVLRLGSLSLGRFFGLAENRSHVHVRILTEEAAQLLGSTYILKKLVEDR